VCYAPIISNMKGASAMINQVNHPYYTRRDVEEPRYDDTAMIVCPDQRIRYENKAARPGANIVRVVTARWRQ